MKRTLFFSLIFAIGCGNSSKVQVQKQWETEPLLKTPESVYYDASRDVLFVSNINGTPLEKDGNGFISKVTPGGEIVELKWVAGLNAPKGIGIAGDRLYVTDIDELVEIQIDSAAILHRYPVAGAKFLNDIAVDSEGNVYFSDSSEENSVIYKFHEGQVEKWLTTDQLRSPNGLYMESGRLLAGSFSDGTILAINLSDKSTTVVAKAGMGIDGLKNDGSGNYVISDWKGKTALVSSSGQVTELLNTSSAHINAADIEYIPDRRLLIIPTFFDNRLMAYTLQK